MCRPLFWLFMVPLLGQGQLSTFAEDWKADKDLKNASIGFCVLDAKSSSVVAEYNAQLALVPASTLKVVTTSAALGLLGNGYRYETRIYHTGTFNRQTGLLNGDLVVYGSGDPTLQSEYFIKDSLNITDQWARLLRDKGVKEISGSIIGDASYFEHTIPDHWIWSDIGNYFGAVPCGLSYHDNKFTIVYRSGATGTKAEVKEIAPNYSRNQITVNSNVTASGQEDEAYVYGDPLSYRKEVTGNVPPNRARFEVEAALPDPALLCAEQLYNSLIKAGIRCRQPVALSNYHKADSLVGGQLLYTHFSPTLDKIVLYTNLKSNNLYCESLLRTLGKGKMSAGVDAVKNYWQKRGLDINELFMADGSGLSRANSLTPGFQARLLCKIYRDSLSYKSFNASLPLAGKSGSMANIGKGTRIENNLRAKTGYITRARGYCGYVRTGSGRDLAFSLIFNNYNCSPREAKLKLEKFMVALADQ